MAVALLAVVSTLLSACTPPPATASQESDELRDVLLTEYRSLVDANGLVANPAGSRVPAVDLWGSALVVGTAQANGSAVDGVHLDRLTRADADLYVKQSHVPSRWVAVALAELARATTGRVSFRWTRLASPVTTDPVDAATEAWIDASTDRSVAQTSRLRERVEALVSAGQGGPVAAWRTLEACDRLRISCSWTGPLEVDPQIVDVAGLVALRAAAELTARGLTVTGWNSAAARELAGPLLDSIADGDELRATCLARILSVAGGGTDAWQRYLDRIAVRRDARTGLYRTFVLQVGTIDNTYTAMRTLGDRFPRLVEGRATAATIRQLLERDDEVDDLTRVRGAAILARFGSLPSTLAGQVDRVAARLDGRTVDLEVAQGPIRELEALRELQRPAPRLQVRPSRPRAESEPILVDVLVQAQDGALANSADLVSTYADYLRRLPAVTIAAGADHPLLLSRIAVLTNVPSELGAAQVEQLNGLVRMRMGCSGRPHMIRTEVRQTAPCELGLTRLAANSGLDLR